MWKMNSMDHQKCHVSFLLQPLVALVGCIVYDITIWSHKNSVIAVKAARGAKYDTFGDPDCAYYIIICCKKKRLSSSLCAAIWLPITQPHCQFSQWSHWARSMHKIPTVTNDFQFQPCWEVNFLAVGTAAATAKQPTAAIEQPSTANARWQISRKIT